MKRISASKIRIIVLIACAASLFTARLFAQSNTGINGQDCGEPVLAQNGVPDHEGACTGWPYGSTVNVDIESNGIWNADQVAAIQHAVEDWNGVGNVTISVYVNNNFPPGGQNAIVISPEHLSEPGQENGVELGNTNAGYDDTTHQTYTASMGINEYMTNTTALAYTAAHEVGHTFGLDDNPSNPNSAMANGCRSLNGTECGAGAPTGTDVSAADCEDSYAGNTCNASYPSSTACSCQAGSDFNCSAGLTCIDGYCGCITACDNSTCPGYDTCSCNPNAPGCNPDCPSICSNPFCPNYELCVCDPEACFICTDPCDPTCPDYDPGLC